LDQEAVDATSNAFKSKLDRFRYTRMGFFMDQSAEPEASWWNPCYSEAAQGEYVSAIRALTTFSY